MALIYPEPEKGGRGKKDCETQGFSSTRSSRARLILRQSRPLAEAVLNGTRTFDDALLTVEHLRQESSSTEAKLERLRVGAPDLAVRVADEQLSIDEAIAILREREATEQRVRADGRAARPLLRFALVFGRREVSY